MWPFVSKSHQGWLDSTCWILLQMECSAKPCLCFSPVPRSLIATCSNVAPNSLFLLPFRVSLSSCLHIDIPVCVCMHASMGVCKQACVFNALWKGRAGLLIQAVTGQSQWDTLWQNLSGWRKDGACTHEEPKGQFCLSLFSTFSLCFVILLTHSARVCWITSSLLS